ncbi:tetratricopeptide repeat protein [Pseudobacteriovorax antillogorgiicola]|uniref:Tetratricopeptide repeat-containing protein n=1 Tax=Pseudobacteriovorax antillogorgiicola TaxID=1513793 RepID=A0A1Y6CFQ7_9BACT|nr:tetratricopeptide repeat protein [Pseudobacteriovorax antillogorgiicola]TCS47307.1 tetratricopeptide repeat protein [Pseudobacteriovorax antillogorgiicola]SMF62618.1 Tetratricopeptide repeat-containing protein [Pseudobacteriovorax antillogorgiicola]
MVRLVILFYALVKSAALLGQGAPASFDPILQHQFRVDIVKLLEISALEVDLDKITSQKKANRAYKSLLSNLDSLVADKNPSAKKLLSAYQDAAAVVHFYGVNGHLSRAEERRIQARDWLADYAERYRAKSKSDGKKDIARYYQLIAQYGRSEGRGTAVTQLIDLKKSLANNKAVIGNIDLMVGYSLILVKATASQGLDYLKRAPSSSVYGRIAHRLTVAMSEAGLNNDGDAVNPPNQKYQKSLSYVVNVSKGAPKGIQILVTNTAFFIWSALNGGLDGKPPFDYDSFKGVIPVDVFRESQAVKAIRSGQYKQGLAIYRDMSDAYQKDSRGVLLDRRIWQIEKTLYQKTRDSQQMRMAFRSIWKRHSKAKKGERKAFFEEVMKDYKDIIGKLLAQAASNVQFAESAIEETKFFLKFLSSRRESYPFRQRLALVYRRSNMFDKAVAAYLDLAKDSPNKNYLLAIEAQSQIAKWPEDPPWQGVAPGDRKARLKLLSLFEQILKSNKQKPWTALAHIGLLHRSVGQVKSAENLWWKYLQKDVEKNRHTSEAAGMLFNDYFQSKRWVNLIELTFLSMKRKVPMTNGGKGVNFQQPFASALFNQGQIDLSQKKYNRSTKYLTDFVRLFKSDPRVPQAYHALGLAYKNLGKLAPALSSFKTLVDKYPSYPKRKFVMLEGGKWAALNKKTMEYAFFFYGKYLREYPNEQDIPQIRRNLAELYMSRKLYGWATRLYKEQSLAAGVPPAWQLDAAIKYLETEEKFGQPKDAVFGANRILQLAKHDSEAAGKAFGFLAKYASSRNDVKAMQALEPKLLAAAPKSVSAREALGMMKFKLAQIFTKPIENNQANAFIKDPEASVKAYYDLFLKEKTHYEAVCRIGITQSCAPAQLKLVGLAQATMLAINDVEIASTLGETRVNAFKVFKQLHLSKLEESAKAYAQLSLKLAREGTTSAIWKTEIIKSLGNKTSFGVAH